MKKSIVVIDSRELKKGRLDIIAKTLRKVALRALKDEQQEGFSKNPIIISDGKYKSKNISIIDKSQSKIDFISPSESLASAVVYLRNRLNSTSPILTGEYLNNHFLQVEGTDYKLIGMSNKQIKDILKDKAEAFIYNRSVYANKLERFGNSKSKVKGNIKFITANGIYDHLSRKVTRINALKGVFVRVGRSNTLPVKNIPVYNLKKGGELVYPVILLRLGR